MILGLLELELKATQCIWGGSLPCPPLSRANMHHGSSHCLQALSGTSRREALPTFQSAYISISPAFIMRAYSFFSFTSGFLLLGWLATNALCGNAPLVLSLERSKYSLATNPNGDRRRATPITQIIDNDVRPTPRISETVFAC